ncbi:hypothetical protein A3F02_02375 [Candidatus Curtissbacteria bacterium RIFCSPHIGHO2_12_FULL_38_9b]|uniref:Uncharacterized protein n=1 Tax=Candidatus Curtissbacteria bacterium RIFCSPHIGHO2_12_FULL_38_9b TaxID=1797720 RepID=A0A1F5GWE0_9BACT|nr:MAG: hypothetical protein A3F02_02375 [Candidatus Curtissbacteria bacterium RIFCSPHIGHO2_12_FULL_38_9b]
MEQIIGVMKQVSSSKSARSVFNKLNFYTQSSLKPTQDTMVTLARWLIWSSSVKFLSDFNLLLVWDLGCLLRASSLARSGNRNLFMEGGV